MATGALQRLRRRAEYLRVQGAERRSAQPGLLLQAAPAPENQATDNQSIPAPVFRVGFTASRKVGNAVLRNRAKRRLKALAQEILPLHAQPGHDYVLVARQATPARGYAELRRDLENALRRLRLWRAPVPAGKMIVPAGETTVPAGKMIVPAGETTVPAGEMIVPAGESAVSKEPGA